MICLHKKVGFLLQIMIPHTWRLDPITVVHPSNMSRLAATASWRSLCFAYMYCVSWSSSTISQSSRNLSWLGIFRWRHTTSIRIINQNNFFVNKIAKLVTSLPHQNSNEEIESLTCKDCKTRFESLTDLKNHIESVNKGKKPFKSNHF